MRRVELFVLCVGRLCRCDAKCRHGHGVVSASDVTFFFIVRRGCNVRLLIGIAVGEELCGSAEGGGQRRAGEAHDEAASWNVDHRRSWKR